VNAALPNRICQRAIFPQLSRDERREGKEVEGAYSGAYSYSTIQSREARRAAAAGPDSSLSKLLFGKRCLPFRPNEACKKVWKDAQIFRAGLSLAAIHLRRRRGLGRRLLSRGREPRRPRLAALISLRRPASDNEGGARRGDGGSTQRRSHARLHHMNGGSARSGTTRRRMTS